MSKLFIFSIIYLGLISCSAQSNSSKVDKDSTSIPTHQKPNIEPIQVGAQQIPTLVDLLNDSKFGIVGNQTSQIFGVHLVDTLITLGLKPKVVFAPEHGFRGKQDAGAKIENGKDVKTNISIISLYGKHKKPTITDLEGLDYIVFDIQDVGVRFYTYISTLHYVMEACAEQNIKVIVLDRPNPNGHLIDGPTLTKENKSFVGMHPIPIAHGMTIGEYAKMINGEQWLKNSVQCELTVIPCKNYTHERAYNLPIKPSPNLPNAQSIMLYPSLCLFEGTTVSVGRGTTMPFQIYGSPELTGPFTFVPKSGPGSKYPKHENKTCKGEDLRSVSTLVNLNLSWLINAYKTSEKPFFTNFFTKLAGTTRLQKQIEQGVLESEIRASWNDDLIAFKRMRNKYIIYP